MFIIVNSGGYARVISQHSKQREAVVKITELLILEVAQLLLILRSKRFLPW